MKTFNVLIPPGSDLDGDHQDALFLANDKAWLAILIPPIWLIVHRLWWALFVYFAVLTIIFLLVLTPFRLAVIYLSAIPGLFLFLEGHELIRQKLERKGWRQVALIQAVNVEEAEIRYYSAQAPDALASDSNRPVELLPAIEKTPPQHLSGLFPLDGRT